MTVANPMMLTAGLRNLNLSGLMMTIQGSGSINTLGSVNEDNVLLNQVWSCLLDQKYILMRYLLIRTVFDKYFNNGFDDLLDVAFK